MSYRGAFIAQALGGSGGFGRGLPGFAGALAQAAARDAEATRLAGEEAEDDTRYEQGRMDAFTQGLLGHVDDDTQIVAGDLDVPMKGFTEALTLTAPDETPYHVLRRTPKPERVEPVAPYDPNADPVVLRAEAMRERGLGPDAPQPRLAGPAPSAAPAGPSGPANDFERKAAFMLEGARSAVTVLDDYQPSLVDRAGSVPLVGNYLTRDTTQAAEQAAATLADAYLRLTTGANYTSHEVEVAARQFLPRPGDSEQVRQLKAERRAQVIRSLEAAAHGDYSGLIAPAESGLPATVPAAPGMSADATRYPENPYR